MSFNFFDTKIEFRIGFFIYAYVFVAIDTSGFSDYFLLSVILHELAHIFTLFYCNIKIEKILFSLSGIYIVSDDKFSLSLKKQLVIMSSGSAFNLFLAIFFALLGINGNTSFLSFSATNLIIGVYNLFIINGLDGGDILRLILNNYLVQSIARRVYVLIEFIFTLASLTLFSILALKGKISILFMCIFSILILLNTLNTSKQ